jgi:hypothetical protein
MRTDEDHMIVLCSSSIIIIAHHHRRRRCCCWLLLQNRKIAQNVELLKIINCIISCKHTLIHLVATAISSTSNRHVVPRGELHTPTHSF